MVDLSFRIRCHCLPVDHAHALSQALQMHLPWLREEVRAGVHVIHGAASGNGWFRPDEDKGELLYLSRRTRMTLRLPQSRLGDAGRLEGVTLDIEGHSLQVGAADVRPFTRSSTLYARSILAAETEGEEAFLGGAVARLAERGVHVRKALCGRSHRIKTPQGGLFARSLMLAELRPEESIALQGEGLGEGRMLGCGLFIPHKGIRAVKPGDDEEEM